MVRVIAESLAGRTAKNLGLWGAGFTIYMLWPYFVRRGELRFWQRKDANGINMKH
jgi:hypothetical protein